MAERPSRAPSSARVSASSPAAVRATLNLPRTPSVPDLISVAEPSNCWVSCSRSSFTWDTAALFHATEPGANRSLRWSSVRTLNGRTIPPTVRRSFDAAKSSVENWTVTSSCFAASATRAPDRVLCCMTGSCWTGTGAAAGTGLAAGSTGTSGRCSRSRTSGTDITFLSIAVAYVAQRVAGSACMYFARSNSTREPRFVMSSIDSRSVIALMYMPRFSFTLSTRRSTAFA